MLGYCTWDQDEEKKHNSITSVHKCIKKDRTKFGERKGKKVKAMATHLFLLQKKKKKNKHKSQNPKMTVFSQSIDTRKKGPQNLLELVNKIKQ